jgi:multiple sugar transport system permease protein
VAIREHRRQSALERERPYLAAAFPAMLLLTLFYLIPAIWAGYTSLTEYTLLGFTSQSREFVGLDNYRRLLNDPDFPKYLKNSLVFVVGSAIIGQTGLGLLFALLFHHATQAGFRLVLVAYTALMAAWVSPPLLTGFIWGRLLDVRTGVINSALTEIGVAPVDFLGQHAMLSVVSVEVWRGTAFATIIFTGALQSIPRQVYEAARCDGAKALARFWDHTLPMLRHVLALVLVMTTINAMGSFLMILVLTNGAPGRDTETIALYAYHRAFGSFEIAFGAAISVVMLVVNSLLTIFFLTLARRRP